jgi:hypothetical protein
MESPFHLGPFTEDEVAQLLREGRCPCAVEDAIRRPYSDSHTVPTSAYCPWHTQEAVRGT